MTPNTQESYFEHALNHINQRATPHNSLDQLVSLYSRAEGVRRQGWTFRIASLLDDCDPISRISRVCEILAAVSPYCVNAAVALRGFANRMGGADGAKRQCVLEFLTKAEEARIAASLQIAEEDLDVA